MLFSSSYAGIANPSLFCTAVAPSSGQSASAAAQASSATTATGEGDQGGMTVPAVEEDKVFDYVICGGGTAGCVLASRLSEDPNVKVLLIEAGESDQKELNSRIPAGFGNLFKTHVDWDYTSTPQPGLDGRELYFPRAKMLGGCSSMNAQIYQRCAPADFDGWAANGATGWSYADLKPYFEKAEGFTPNPEYKIDAAKRNTSGPWKTGYPRSTAEISKAFVETGPAIGLPKNPDLNVETNSSGITRFQTIASASGVRSSTSSAYLPPSVFQTRRNLKILTSAICTRILFDEAKDEDGKAKVVGIEVAWANPKNESDKVKRWIAHGKEYLLTLGAYATPQLLLCSGIGRESTLTAAGIKQRPLSIEAQGVGEGLKDHMKVPFSWTVEKGASLEWMKTPAKVLPSLFRWLAFGTGPLTTNIAEAGAFLHHEDIQEDGTVKLYDGPTRTAGPDLEIVSCPLYFQRHTLVPPPADTETQDFFTTGPIVLKPYSSGKVTIKSGDMREKAIVDAGYLSEERDLEIIRKGLLLTRRLSQSAPLKQCLLSVARPRLSLVDLAGAGDDELLKHAKDVAETIYHPTSSCKMGPLSDRGVVSPVDLKVHGTNNLRVCDASVFPDALGGHPCATVVAIAEKFSDMLKAEHAAVLA
ncbi:hypothetical protein JCM11251_001805 [Rhodosporidiobolus azoricus]